MVGPPIPSGKLTIKFLCSYGGRIIPRQTDGKLRYQGGDTRVLAVDRSISFSGQFLINQHLFLFIYDLFTATLNTYPMWDSISRK